MLRRTKVGCFDLSRAISLEKLEELVHSAPQEDWILNVVTVLDDILALAVTESQRADLQMGRRFKASDLICDDYPSDGFYRLMFGEKLVALANIEEGTVKPIRVFNL
jgi:tRNA pseudouridine55 synthase